jgi:hypothetical protein
MSRNALRFSREEGGLLELHRHAKNRTHNQLRRFSNNVLSFGAGLAVLLVDTQAVHALCKIKRAL